MITVIGRYRPENPAKNPEPILVPFERLSQTLQQIHRQGGNIIEMRDTHSGLIRLNPTEFSSPKTATNQKRRKCFRHFNRQLRRHSPRKTYKIYTLG